MSAHRSHLGTGRCAEMQDEARDCGASDGACASRAMRLLMKRDPRVSLKGRGHGEYVRSLRTLLHSVRVRLMLHSLLFFTERGCGTPNQITAWVK